jgi:hypothetical protein
LCSFLSRQAQAAADAQCDMGVVVILLDRNPIGPECVVEREKTPEGHGFLPSDPIPAVSPWLRGFSHRPLPDRSAPVLT